MNVFKMEKMNHHAIATLKTLDVCRKNNFLCDFTVIVNNKAFRLHRVVLAACSEYFSAMFSHDTKELREGYSTMVDLEPEAVRQCIDFMYTGKASPVVETAQPLLHASCLLHLEGLTELCFETLKKDINLNNCLFLKQLSHTYNSNELEKHVDEFILRNFESIVSDRDFVNLRLEDLIYYFTSSDIQVSSVLVYWRAILKWVYYDLKNRKKYNTDLMKHLRLEDFPMDFIQNTIWNNSLVQEFNTTRNVVAQAIFKQVAKDNGKDVVTIKSCLFIKELGKLYACKEAEAITDRFVLDNFEDVMKEEAFLHLPKEDVIRYVKSPEVRYVSDSSLWKAALAWVKSELDQRKNMFPELLQYVKLEIMPADYLKNTVRNEPLVKASDSCKEMLMDALFRQVTKARKQGLAVIDRSSKVLKAYEPSSGQWYDMENVKMNFHFNDNIYAMVIEKYLYVLIKKSLFRIDWSESGATWTEMAPMHIKREAGPAVAVVGQYIYVVDGRSIPVTADGSILHKTPRQPKRGGAEAHMHSGGEYYDSAVNLWNHIPAMPTLRSNGSLATSGGLLYLIGGKIQARKDSNWMGMHASTNAVECYDTDTRKWLAVNSMSVGRYDAASAVINGRIFVMGGINQQGRLKEVEVFDTLIKSWSQVQEMNVPRSFFSASVINGSIYVVGGDYRKDAYDKTIEVFDLHRRTWEIVKKLNMKIYDNTAVVVNVEQ